MLGVRGDGVERPVGADILRFVDIELDRPGRRPLSGDQRFNSEIFVRENFEIVERARDDRPDDHGMHIALRQAFELEQLMEPDRIFVGRPARVGRDPPARADVAAVDQGEDEVGIAGIDGEQHGRVPSLAAAASQLDVAGANDLQRAVVAAKAQRAIGFEAVEAARDTLSGASMNRQRRPDRVRAGKPGLGNQARVVPAPQAQQPLEGTGEQQERRLAG